MVIANGLPIPSSEPTVSQLTLRLHKLLYNGGNFKGVQHRSESLLAAHAQLTILLVDLVTRITTFPVDYKGDEEVVKLSCSRREIDQILLLVPIAYLNRGALHVELGYHDLSASDAYRAMLTVDRVREWVGEVAEGYEFMGQEEKAGSDVDTDKGLFGGLGLRGVLLPGLQEIVKQDGQNTSEWETESLELVVDELDRLSLYLVIRSLIYARCLRPAWTYLVTAASKFPRNRNGWDFLTRLLYEKRATGSSTIPIDPQTLPIRGFSRREVYPWNSYEPDRFSAPTLAHINATMRECSVSNDDGGGPWCEVRCVELPRLHPDGTTPDKMVKQLGVFALRDIPASIPGISSSIPPPHPYLIEPTTLLAYTTTGGLQSATEQRCQMCTRPIPEGGPDQTHLGCDLCEENDIWPLFCNVTCRDRAMQLYHPAICGIDWQWLHREANMNIAAESEGELAYNDDAIYALLLQRAWALALTQGKHPLELPEVWYLYGAGKRRQKYPELDGPIEVEGNLGKCPENQNGDDAEDDLVPFDFHQVVIVPNLILDSLGIEILPFPRVSLHCSDSSAPTLSRSPSLALTHFDTPTSTITLLNKFKGVASLTRHTDTRCYPPIETVISAVHPLYSLVNHECDPNIYWEVSDEGHMCLRALSADLKSWRNTGGEGEVRWRGEWDEGVRRGEQLIDSYVNPGLEVRERRKRIWGVLGGPCVCQRCQREAGRGGCT